MDTIKKIALRNSLLTTLYIVGVGCFMFFGAKLKIGRANSMLVPIALLLLFVFSAALTGYLIFGKPVQLYLDDKKKEALMVVKFTMIYFSVITFVALLLLILFTR